ncbi:MAG: Histidine phosphatase superfamily (branch 1) [Firmicutes bacterium]|nr:Histidine phosphatase superfamily (branch 1) [Bacillota bacterium]
MGNHLGNNIRYEDIPLDEDGIKQAMKLSKRTVDFQVSKIYSSPLSRTKQNAEAMNSLSCVNIEFRDPLIEYDHGIILKLTLNELADQDDDGLTRTLVLGAESVCALLERARSFNTKLTYRYGRSLMRNMQ